MKTIIKEINLYKYEELSDKSKETARQNYIENIDSQDFTDNLMEDLRSMGLESLRPYYSLSYCQGDGLCLVGHIDFDEINQALKDIFYKDFTFSDYRLLRDLPKDSRVEFNHIGRYYHKNSVDINIYIDGNISTKKYNGMRKLADNLIKNIKEWYINKCEEYEKCGYEFFYDIDDEELAEFYDVKGYEFLQDGTIFR